MDTVQQQLEEARQSLLDMSMRNKLLNFQEYKRSTARVVDEVPSEVYRRLVVDGHTMYFQPGEGDADSDVEVLDREEAVEVDDEGSWRCRLCAEPDEGDEESSTSSEDEETPEDAKTDHEGIVEAETTTQEHPDDVGESTTPRDAAVFLDEEGFLDHLEVEHDATLEEHHDRPGNLWELPEAGDGDRESYRDTKLRTPHPEEDLQKRLYKVSNKAEALIEDAGYNALYLAIGFLEWTNPRRQDDGYRAPLVLVPVEIEREGARSAFKIRWNQDEVVGNQTLRLKLSEHGFELPEFERPDDADGVQDYLERVDDAAEEFTDWTVEPDIHLGFFDFTKFVMYQDLDPDGWEETSPADHPLIRSLLDPDSDVADQEPSLPDDSPLQDEEDGGHDPMEQYHVKDADPSQISAIEEVKDGESLVIEGPPGTGKSQTIVNLIAELLADDRSVLFVSEKLAALEVVKQRLDEVGLGDFCLELHSDSASRSEFLDELERLANLDSYDAEVPGEIYRDLRRRRDELDGYAEAMAKPFGAVERTPHELYGARERAEMLFESRGREMPRVHVEDVREVTVDEYEEARRKLDDLAGYLEDFHPVAASPWYGCQPGRVLPEERRELESHLEHAVRVYERYSDAVDRIDERYPVREVESLEQLTATVEAVETLERDVPVAPEVAEDSVWDSRPDDADEVIQLVARVSELQEDVGARTDPEELDRDVADLRRDVDELKGKLTRWLRPRWYGLRNEVEALYSGDRPRMSRVADDLEDLVELDIKLDRLDEVDDRGRELFGELWQGADTDPGDIESFAEWILPFRSHLIEGVYDGEDVVSYLEGEGSNRPHEPLLAEAEAEAEDLEEALQNLVDRLDADVDAVFGDDVPHAKTEVVGTVLRDWRDGTDDLERWARYNEVREEVLDTAAAGVVAFVDGGVLQPDELVPCFEGSFAEDLLDNVLREREVLARFDGEVHERVREEFQELDERSFALNRRRVMERLVHQAPRLMEGASKSSAAGALMHEFGKQRRHKPIRVLLQDAGELVQQMKPCFMMSPLSVAKYLDPEDLEFDVVVFDEASQVRPEDALGALLRADQVVMLGDSKQLPPTGFFDQIVDQVDADDPWAFSVQDVESVLDLCKATLPTRRLRWHYRSRHESLIEVSNQEFYDDDLLVYPSPHQDADDLGLELRHLPDTHYDRGGSSVNRGEARAVAEAAVEHFRENPDESLGVGTFSQSQQQAVLEEVERLRKQNPEVDEQFQGDREEPFFVKNLERIQGDERDVIFVSVGYGYDEDGGFSLNFGPLNQDGGWRRLNVLITRARKRCVVYSNFKAAAIDASKTSSRGVESLKTFLEHAEEGGAGELSSSEDEAESAFVGCVREFLESQGYQVEAEVGCAGYRVDLAVEDPDDDGSYAVGVLCDGPSYHDAESARARDRQREAVLEDRGWRLQRVWSTDWYRDRDRAREELVAAVEDAVHTDKDSVDDGRGRRKTEDGDDLVSLEQLQDDDPAPSIHEIAEPYDPARDVPFVMFDDADAEELLPAVEAVVEQEAPIHRELLYRRLVDRSDVDRVSQSVKDAVDKAVFVAEQRGELDSDYGFVRLPGEQDVVVRRREGEEAEIDWVPPEEIREAVVEVLEAQYGAPEDDLVRQVAGLLGFDRTGRRISMKVEEVVEELLDEGRLEERSGRLEA